MPKRQRPKQDAATAKLLNKKAYISTNPKVLVFQNINENNTRTRVVPAYMTKQPPSPAKSHRQHDVKLTKTTVLPRRGPAVARIQAFFRMKQAKGNFQALRSAALVLQKIRRKHAGLRRKRRAPAKLGGVLLAIV